MDLLGMWIDSKYDELFATLKAMTRENRINEVKCLCREMAYFDECNSASDSPTDELPRFLDECIARL